MQLPMTPATFTNRHGIDDMIARAVERNLFYDTPDCDITVSQLVRPPQMAYLEQIHAHEIVEDVGDRLWALLGSAVHEVLRKSADSGLTDALPEQRIIHELEGWSVGGQADLWRARPDGGEIVDYKVTSVWSFVLDGGSKRDWEEQLNFYAVLYRLAGFPVTALKVSAILRDWIARKAKEEAAKGSDGNGDGKYPPVPFASVAVPVWPAVDAERRLRARVREHQQARAGQYRECSPEERWADPEKWAVMIPAQKRAIRLFDEADMEGAIALAESLPEGARVEHRPGRNPLGARCADYCVVRDFCAQKAALNGQ